MTTEAKNGCSILDGDEFIGVIKAFHIGRFNGEPNSNGRPRPLKVILQSEEQVNMLLKRNYIR